MKSRIFNSLTFSLRLFLRRLFVSFVGSTVRVVARFGRLTDRLLKLAVANGLNLNEVWPRSVEDRRFAPEMQTWGAQDFLFMMDALSGKGAIPAASEAIKASIIIPVCNNFEYTVQCLRSLLREVDFSDTEVIVVNNGSTDDTPRVLSYFKQFVRAIHNHQNVGFVDACNQGAAAAHGKYLVFLNSEMFVLSGWLKHLRDTIESNPAIGAVGSMLLYPDGQIQEAGGIVWRDASVALYGWGKDPEDRRYKFAREVDYCSASSLLIRKEIFQSLGGFDRRYAPAYYEDVDLCFGTRALGYKVVYQPMSRVIHSAGATAGRDLRSGYKRFEEINRAKFFEKWREVLQREQREKKESRLAQAANRRCGPRVIVFDDRVPLPDRDAGSARMFLILKALVQWTNPVFISLGKPISDTDETILEQEGVETAHINDYQRLLKERDFAVAILSRPDTANALLSSIRRIDSSIKIIFDTVDLAFHRLRREYKLSGDSDRAREARKYEKLEKRLVRESDQIWCATPEDAEVLSREVSGARIEIVPTIHPLRGRGKSFDEREGLIFIGGFLHRPNPDAVRHFIDEIYPLVCAAIPDLKFYVVGGDVPAEIMAYESDNVRITGHISDVDSIFERSRIFVAPLRYGAGMKGKVGHALSYGLPVVTTSIGAEGFGMRHRQEAMIVDEPQAFAEAVIQVYQSRELWQQLSDNGYTHLQRHFTPEVVAQKLRAAITKTSPGKKAEWLNTVYDMPTP